MHDDDTPQLTKEDQQKWYTYLSEFERDVWPTLKTHGFSRDTALIVWTLNRVVNQVIALEEALIGEEDD